MNKVTLAFVAAIISTSANANWTFTDLHSSPYPHSSHAFAINNSNQIVGYQYELVGSQPWRTATLWNGEAGGSISLLTPGKLENSTATDINNIGQIVADRSQSIISQNQAFLIGGGSVTQLQSLASSNVTIRNLEINNLGHVLGYTFSSIGSTYWETANNPVALNKVVNGINDSGEMAGQAIFGGEKHASLYENGNTVDLGVGFGWATRSTAIDINNNGQVIATAFGPLGGYRSYIWENGTTRSLMSTGNPSEATSINEHGIVVGNQFTHLPTFTEGYLYLQTEAVMWDGHNQYRLNDFLDADSKEAGWVLVTANDINDNGWVVGQAFNTITREAHAYVLSTEDPLSPIPEPSTYLMLLAGLGLLGFVVRCKT